MTTRSKIKPDFGAVNYFKELPFYNKSIKKPKVKRLKNIDRLIELPQAFSGHAASNKVGIVERKDPIVQLEAS